MKHRVSLSNGSLLLLLTSAMAGCGKTEEASATQWQDPSDASQGGVAATGGAHSTGGAHNAGGTTNIGHRAALG